MFLNIHLWSTPTNIKCAIFYTQVLFPVKKNSLNNTTKMKETFTNKYVKNQKMFVFVVLYNILYADPDKQSWCQMAYLSA